MKKINLIIILIVGISHLVLVKAQDRLFTYTYQSSILNKGQKELEIWNTLATGKDQFYRSLEHRIEFEVGLGKKVQTSFYLNYGSSKTISLSEDSLKQIVETNSQGFSFSNEWKLKLSDPVANKIGSALYAEMTIGTGELELEGKLILDKQTGKFVQALNISGELEMENSFKKKDNKIEKEIEKEGILEFNYALMFKPTTSFGLGIELRNHNVINEEKVWENSAFFAGPVLSYSTKNFWINLTVLPQITNFKGSGLDLHDHEKFNTRLLFSYVF